MLVPAEIRRQLDPAVDGEALFLVTGINGKLWMYPERHYESFAVNSISEMSPELERLEFDQLSFGTANRVEWDKQGRILLPEKVMRKAGFGKGHAVTMVGVKDHAEVWDTADWERHEQELERRRTEIALKGKPKPTIGPTIGPTGQAGRAEL